MEKRLPIYQVEIDENDQLSGIQLISIVDSPAMESNFVKLSEEKVSKLHLSNDEKQYVTGAVLIPNKHIYRNDDGEEYYITFSAEGIEKIRNKFFRQGETKLSNLDHDGNKTIKGYIVESWIVKDSESGEAAKLGLQVPVGTLIATYHFEDKATWMEVKERNGFSIEAFLNMKPLKASLEKSQLEMLLDELLEQLNSNI